MSKNTLFSEPVENLKFGVEPGSHVVHILPSGKGTAFTQSDVNVIDYSKYDYSEVSKEEVYNTISNQKTGAFMQSLAKEIENDYSSELATKEFSSVLEKIRDYVLASGRQSQQDAIMHIKEELAGCFEKISEELDNFEELGEDKLTKEQKEIYQKESKIMERLIHYSDKFQKQFSGDLELPEDVRNKMREEAPENVSEPSYSGVSGFLSLWIGNEKSSLFPHEPSPDDIKQGVGVDDCYVLSALTQFAARNPEKIKEAMKDNGDGTVSVRFFNKSYDPSTKGFNAEPVFVRVKKTESRVAGIGAAYASSSVWVQMMEKAYAKYVDQTKNQKKGLSGINRGVTKDFMDAFDKDSYEDAICKIGFSDSTKYVDANEISSNYAINRNGKFAAHKEGYYDNENLLYGFLKEKADLNGEVITTGCSEGKGARHDFIINHGIRTEHAYTIMKTFEANVNGQMKKFIQLRDPYALFESTYDKDGNLKNRSTTLDVLAGHLQAGNENMGTFNIELADYCRIFDSLPGLKAESWKEFNSIQKALNDSRLDIKVKDILSTRSFATEVSRDEKDLLRTFAIKNTNHFENENEKAAYHNFVTKFYDPEISETEKTALLTSINEFRSNPLEIKIPDKDSLTKYWQERDKVHIPVISKVNSNPSKISLEDEFAAFEVDDDFKEFDKSAEEEKTEIKQEKISNDFDDIEILDELESNIKESDIKEVNTKEQDIKELDIEKINIEKLDIEELDFEELDIEIGTNKDKIKNQKTNSEKAKTVVEKINPAKEIFSISSPEEYIAAYKNYLNQYSNDLKKAKSAFNNSNQFQRLEKAVKEGVNCSPDEIENNLQRIGRLAEGYIRYKQLDGISGKSVRKVALTEDILEFTKAGIEKGKDIDNQIEQKKQKHEASKEQISLNDLDDHVEKKKESKEKRTEKTKTSKDLSVSTQRVQVKK